MYVNMLGVRIDNLTLKDAVDTVMDRMSVGKETIIYTPNPIMVHQAIKDDSFRRILNHSHLNLPDGVGLTLAAKILKLPLTHRVAGIKFGETLMTVAEQRGLRVFLLGAKPGVANVAAKELRKKHPHLVVCGTCHGYFGEKDSQHIRKTVEHAKTDILLVCMGSPRQEIWIANNHPRVSVCAALGGTLDVWAGNVKRAPALLSQIGLEWLWRMCLEPRRAAKIPDLLGFLFDVLREEFFPKNTSPKSNLKVLPN